jgi:molybdopterin/thiamine biosynthesis adenylyltransferase
MMLTDLERERYFWQLVMPEWSGEAQKRLRASGAIVVGAGALGSPAALYLAAAGVGRLGIVDSGAVEVSGLHRQVLHFTPDVGLPKAENAAVKLRALNPEVQVDPYPAQLDASNAEAIFTGADVVIDCTNGEDTHHVVNDACCALGVPLVVGSVEGLAGEAMSIVPGRTACYRCVFPEPVPSDASAGSPESGVLGAVAGIVGAAQALEAIKLLTGVGAPLVSRILRIDGATMEQTLVTAERRTDCPACSRVPAAAQS